MNPSYYSWTTKDEIAYIEGIGTWGQVPIDPRPILRKYLKAKRDWGEMDKKACLQCARKRLGGL